MSDPTLSEPPALARATRAPVGCHVGRRSCSRAWPWRSDGHRRRGASLVQLVAGCSRCSSRSPCCSIPINDLGIDVAARSLLGRNDRAAVSSVVTCRWCRCWRWRRPSPARRLAWCCSASPTFRCKPRRWPPSRAMALRPSPPTSSSSRCSVSGMRPWLRQQMRPGAPQVSCDDLGRSGDEGHANDPCCWRRRSAWCRRSPLPSWCFAAVTRSWCVSTARPGARLSAPGSPVCRWCSASWRRSASTAISSGSSSTRWACRHRTQWRRRRRRRSGCCPGRLATSCSTRWPAAMCRCASRLVRRRASRSTCCAPPWACSWPRWRCRCCLATTTRVRSPRCASCCWRRSAWRRSHVDLGAHGTGADCRRGCGHLGWLRRGCGARHRGSSRLPAWPVRPGPACCPTGPWRRSPARRADARTRRPR